MTGRLLGWVGVAGLLLGACTGGPAASSNARIVAFTSSVARVPRGEPITLTWQAADAGVQDGLFSCVLTRRFGDEPTATTLQATCVGSVADVPPAPATAAAVHYRFEVLKQPYDADDPYVASELTVTLDAARFASRAGGAGTEFATSLSTLDDGGAIVAGYFDGAADFGATTLTSAGNYDVYVARIQPDGTWAWATRAGGTDADNAWDVRTLPDGGAIVAGSFSGTATFGTTSITSAGSFDAFVARIDPDGTWAWATHAGGVGFDQGLAGSVLADGGAIVAGSFLGTATFGTTELISVGGSDAFVARIDPDGTWAWATHAGGMDVAGARGVSALADGGAIVVGSFTGTAAFGTTALVSAGVDDAFVARIAPGGTWTWATRVGAASYDYASSVGTLPDGGALVVGNFIGTATFGAAILTSAGGRDAFVARIQPDGTWAWAAHAGGTDSSSAQGISALSDGSAIVAGNFSGTATFGATTLTSSGSDDAFIARIQPDGTWAWATRAGGAGFENAVGVGDLADSGAIVTGYFGGTAIFGATTLTSAGSYDTFVARIGADGAW